MDLVAERQKLIMEHNNLIQAAQDAEARVVAAKEAALQVRGQIQFIERMLEEPEDDLDEELDGEQEGQDEEGSE
jgi:hypothetical protein